MTKSKKRKPKVEKSHPAEIKLKSRKKCKVSMLYFIIPALIVALSLIITYPKSFQTFKALYEKWHWTNIGSEFNGGWELADSNTLQKYSISKCDIDRRFADEITSEEFQNLYQYKKPLILRFRNGAIDWTDPSKWTVLNLKLAYGQYSVLSGTSRDIVRKGGNGDTDSSFTEFLQKMHATDSESEPQYLFDRKFYNASGLPQTIRPPDFIRVDNNLDDSIFFLGGSGSGVSFHQHADAWNGVVYGQKRWFLYPIETTPPGGVYPGFTQMEWFSSIYPKLHDSNRPLECIQHAGEIFYLPENIYHSTINIGDTIAVGIQKKLPNTEIGKLFDQCLPSIGGCQLPPEGRGFPPGIKLVSSHNKTVGDLEKEPQTMAVKQQIRDVLLKLTELLPENTEVMMKLGSAYNNLDETNLAFKVLREALERDPWFILAWLELAKVYEKLGDIQSAERCFEQGIHQNTTLWDVYAFSGDFYLRQGKPEKAAKMYKAGIMLKPRMVTFWKMLKLAQEQMGDSKGANFSQEWIDLLSLDL